MHSSPPGGPLTRGEAQADFTRFNPTALTGLLCLGLPTYDVRDTCQYRCHHVSAGKYPNNVLTENDNKTEPV
jgi:hypothetical protein